MTTAAEQERLAAAFVAEQEEAKGTRTMERTPASDLAIAIDANRPVLLMGAPGTATGNITSTPALKPR